jgi:hypothetical protein
LIMSLLGSTILESCGGSSDESGAEDSYEEVEVYEKGVKMQISETAKDEYKIMSEEVVSIDSSIAVITKLDGSVLKLNPKEAQELINGDIQKNEAQIGQNRGLSNVLLFGGMGYLLAKTTNPTYAQYRPEMNNGIYTTNKNVSDTTRRRRHGFYGFFYGGGARYVASSAVASNIENSRNIRTRATGARSGFFGGRVRSTFGG